jgi:hypothetical protein
MNDFGKLCCSSSGKTHGRKPSTRIGMTVGSFQLLPPRSSARRILKYPQNLCSSFRLAYYWAFPKPWDARDANVLLIIVDEGAECGRHWWVFMLCYKV